MRHYIGNRLVEAEEAVRIDGKVYTYDGPIPKAMNREEGYKVYYPDGYETFMKKGDFEKIYHLHEREELAKAAEEQGCTTCEECCDCCNDTGTAEPAENEKTDNEECTPPMDRMWESETDSYTAKNYSFDSAEKLKEKLTSKVDIPEDGNKVFIHITEEEDGHLQSVIIGSPIKTIPALEAVFVETTLGAFEKDAPDFIKKLMVTAAVANMKNKLMDALGCTEKREDTK